MCLSVYDSGVYVSPIIFDLYPHNNLMEFNLDTNDGNYVYVVVSKFYDESIFP